MANGDTAASARDQAFIAEIQQAAGSLQLSPETIETLRSTELVCIIGPLVVGKTSLMRTIEAEYPDFGRVQGFTTRPRRREEPYDTYRWLDHAEPGFEHILDMMQKGEVVQVAVHPTTGYVYGSSKPDYQRRYSMRDTLTSAVERMGQLPLGGIIKIGVVAPPQDWSARFDVRQHESGADDIRKRLLEGAENLRWLLGQEEGGVQWVVNRNGGLHDAARMVVDLARGEGQGSPDGHEVGEALLVSIEERLLRGPRN